MTRFLPLLMNWDDFPFCPNPDSSYTSKSRSMFSCFGKYLSTQDHRFRSPTLSFIDEKTEVHPDRGGMTIRLPRRPLSRLCTHFGLLTLIFYKYQLLVFPDPRKVWQKSGWKIHTATDFPFNTRKGSQQSCIKRARLNKVSPRLREILRRTSCV